MNSHSHLEKEQRIRDQWRLCWKPRPLLEHCVETTISIYSHSSLRPGSSSKVLLPFPSHRIYLVFPQSFSLLLPPLQFSCSRSSQFLQLLKTTCNICNCPTRSLLSTLDSQYKRSVSKEFSVFQVMILALPFFYLLQTFIKVFSFCGRT